MGLEDGMRRYEELLKDIEEKADQALAMALASGVIASGAVLGIANGGTGSSVKNFVDLDTNQYNIFGSKRFNASCVFQKQSDIVDSGELAGNVRLVSCDEQGVDIGPQLRYSGRFEDDNLTPFAFATTAGRKENDVSGDQSGYYHISTTGSDGHIYEAMRANSEQNVGFGAIPIIGSGDRIHISGGDVFIDSVGGPRIIKIQIGETIGRIQAIENFDGTFVESDSLIISVNAEMSANACLLDNASHGFGSAAIDVRANTVGATETGGMIRFLVGDINECPSIRGQFTIDGLDVIGNAYVTNNIVAGGVNNIVNGVGNNVADPDGFVTSDNIKFGAGSPEGVVYAPIGAVYGRGSGSSDNPDENSTLWVKVFNDNGNTGWRPVRMGDSEISFCIQANCPTMVVASDSTEAPECPTWYDTGRNMWFYWDPTVVRSLEPDLRGAWLSSDIFQLLVPVEGRSHAQQFKGQINKDYEYITPLRTNRYKLNLFLLDMTASLRQAFNGNDREANYYTFDLMTLTRRQGDPSATKSTRQEWPGDREPYENKRDNLRGDGHSIHLNLSDDLLALSSTTPSGPPIDGTGSVTTLGTNRRVLIDSSKTWTASQWKERENDDASSNLPANNGYRCRIITGPLAGQERTINDNTANTLSMRRPWDSANGFNVPQVGDQYEIVDSQHQRIIARISTKGNVWPYGAHVDYTQDVTSDPPPLFDGYQYDDSISLVTASQAKSGGLYKTRDVQDFVSSIRNGLASNNAGGSDDSDTHYIPLSHYIDIFGIESGTDINPTDAVALVGLWDAVRRPGEIAGVISITYRLALPPAICDEGATYS